MANKPPPLSIYEEKIELMGTLKTSHFSQRTARFLNPVAKNLNQSTPFLKPTQHSKPLFFKGWKPPPTTWPEWVNQMAGKHSAVWIKSGILDSIMTSIYDIPYNHNIISTLSHFWTPKTNTFIFPWGEATITLEDVTTLGGYSVTGDSVHAVASIPDLAGKVEVMNQFRSELVRSKAKKASHSKWIQMFMTNANQHPHENEHIGFLVFWLSRFVFPSGDKDSVGKHVIPIAVRLSQGVKLALAPAVLAYIYHNLTKLKEQNLNTCVNLLGPFQLVQIWGYERFPNVGPKSPNELRPGEPRLARWHTLNSNVSSPFESFIWRPYAVDLKNWKQPLYYQDSELVLSDSLSLDDDLRSFVCFVTPCELNGLGCKAEYHPHRVAMQFGFDQDIPGECDLSGYKFVKFFVPSRLFRPGVSKRYSDWWDNADQMDLKNGKDSSMGEGMNVSVERKKCDFERVDLSLEDEFDDILVSLKKICNATKRKIDSLKQSCVDVPQSKKKKLGSEIWNGTNDNGGSSIFLLHDASATLNLQSQEIKAADNE
ncbi:hypothetical protein L1987_85185 [Smallanthus sonchifolius]|uniref:Uncharacterized protein n=1 Tax=Smallanthus sonchifolius TaxID=185202 RepID=A0ACB8XX07_9ASTR|nr:hypothetical protein L1987_85185 [Smallanthus sonchifolius]